MPVGVRQLTALIFVRLVVQRTKLIDETQEILLELLEEMTTGRCYLTRAELMFH